MPRIGEVKAVAKVLADEANADLTAEEVAEKAIEAYEEVLSRTHRLIALGHFTYPDRGQFVAAAGPLSTRAAKAARELGAGFAWDWKTRRGEGKFLLVPLVRHPRDAWNAARDLLDPAGAALRDAFDAVPGDVTSRRYGPTCTCGLPTAKGPCSRHPGRRPS